MKRVRYILAVFLSLFALSFLFYSFSLGRHSDNIITGNSAASYTDEFEIKYLYSELRDGKLEVKYSVEEKSGKTRKINVEYEVYDLERVYFKENQEVILDANKLNEYKFTARIPVESKGNLMLRVSDGEEENVFTSFLSNGITGKVVQDTPVTLTWKFLLFMAFLGILFFLIRKIKTSKEYSKVAEARHDSGLIKLDMN